MARCSWLRTSASRGLLVACLLGSILLLASQPASGLSCPGKCERSTCLSRAVSKCAYGRVLDSCGCCAVCGNGPGEACGGEFLMLGVCGKGYECRSNLVTEQQPPEFAEGVCVRKIGKSLKQQFRVKQRLPPGLKLLPPRSTTRKPHKRPAAATRANIPPKSQH